MDFPLERIFFGGYGDGRNAPIGYGLVDKARDCRRMAIDGRIGPGRDLNGEPAMNAFLLIPFTLSPFFLRDYFLLQAGPARLLTRKLRLYALAVLCPILLLAVATSKLSNQEFINLLRKPILVLPTVALYVLLLTVCLWIRRTDRHHWAWLLALAPNPILAFCLALVARLMFSPSSVYAVIGLSSVPACAWVGLVSMSLRGTERFPMDVGDLDFSIRVAAWANVVALLLYQPNL